MTTNQQIAKTVSTPTQLKDEDRSESTQNEAKQPRVRIRSLLSNGKAKESIMKRIHEKSATPQVKA